MTEELSEYAKFFHFGQRVRVGIPVRGNRLFHEWGVVNIIDQDYLELQLSRDVLPEEVELDVGTILEVRLGKEGSGYRCRAIMISAGSGRLLLTRLIGEIISDELREYFRIDVYLPLRYSIPAGMESAAVEELWQQRCKLRSEAKYQLGSFLQSGAAKQPATEHDADYLDWDSLMPIAANISGGGARFRMTEELRQGELLSLELYLPGNPPKVLDIVGQVVYTQQLELHNEEERFFSTAMRFLHIHERDRDHIIKYVSAMQLRRMRQLRRSYLYWNLFHESGEAEPARLWRKAVKYSLAACIAIILLIVIGNYLVAYHRNPTRHEIQDIFETGLRKYIDKMK